ncbi:MAG: RNA polymerase subunit sigma [Leptolyngbya foveolarum]|uniref:RNA polymerase subunit sigma n=1 Tax=Leptolyngbya foveolarum TaxID=47253 RepID=A0A2W4UTH3_9CYAN|nr:MAG: RNA polymerase subunit sigma [Leptolyngbya foveolarum]
MPSLRSQSPPPPHNSSPVSDALLCAALKQGSADALGILYDRHAGLVYGVALKVLKNAQAAEDLTQDIFLSLTKNNTYNPSRGALRTYLTVLTRSRAIDRLRAEGTRTRAVTQLKRSHPLSSNNSTANQPLERASQKETSLTVETALSQISVEERQILQMMYFEGQTQAAIAEQMQIPLGTVKTRSRRGLLKLRKILSS